MPYTPDSVLAVGGKGTGASANDSNGGGFFGLNATWDNCQGTNGATLTSFNNIEASEITDSAGKVRISRASIGSGLVTGVWVYCDWDAGTWADGRYYLLTVSADYIELAFAPDFTGVNPPQGDATDIQIGGALLTLEAAKDLVVDGDATDVLISHDLTVGAATTFTNGGDKTDNDKWLRIRGVDTDGVLLTAGTYRTIDRQAAGTDVVVWDDIDNAEIDRMHLTGGDAGAGLYINDGTAAHYNYRVFDCNLTACKYGVRVGDYRAGGSLVLSCSFSSNTTNDVLDESYQSSYINCSFASDIAVQVTVFLHTSFYGCKFTDGQKAIRKASEGAIICVGCVFYGQRVACVENASANGTFNIYNNIFMPAETADKAILVSAGSIVDADHNVLWSKQGAACASDVSGANDLEVDPGFVNAAGGDFRIKPESAVWNKGMATLHGGYSTPGLWGRMQIPNRIFEMN